MKITCLLLLILLAFPGICLAQDSELSFDDQVRAQIAELAIQIAEQEQSLRQEDYSEYELGEYQFTYMQFVYLGKALANRNSGSARSESDADLSSLVSSGFLPSWPNNPLNDWNPVGAINSAGTDSALPGDLVLEVCPNEYFSLSESGLAGISFNLYVITTDEMLSGLGKIAIYGENKDWAVHPENAVYGLGYYTQSEARRQEAYSRK